MLVYLESFTFSMEKDGSESHLLNLVGIASRERHKELFYVPGVFGETKPGAQGALVSNRWRRNSFP